MLPGRLKTLFNLLNQGLSGFNYPTRIICIKVSILSLSLSLSVCWLGERTKVLQLEQILVEFKYFSCICTIYLAVSYIPIGIHR